MSNCKGNCSEKSFNQNIKKMNEQTMNNKNASINRIKKPKMKK